MSVFSKTKLLCSSLLFAANAYSEITPQINLLDFELEDLTQVQISSVANRYKTDVIKSASAVTIISEEEIQRHGYKTLDELLQSVVGFDEAYHIYRPLISSRGFRQDINTNYLLLIDGHRINENAYSGFGILQTYPLMDNIKQVEIIRGASSTLWGGSALNGIISITTKSAKEYSNSSRQEGIVEGSIDYEIEYNRRIANTTYAKTTKDYDFTFSAMGFDNTADPTHLYAYGNTEATPFRSSQALYNYYPSYQLYSTFNYKEFSLHISHSDESSQDNQETVDSLQIDGLQEYKATWLELLYTPQLSDTLSLESRFFYDNKKKNFYDIQRYTQSSFLIRNYQDKGFGSEIILHQDTKNYHLLTGLYGQLHTLDSADYKFHEYQHANDKILAAFGELNYTALESWTFTIGARFEHGQPRGDTHTFMPRAMILKELNEKTYIKYMYNSGSLRPTLLTTRGYTREIGGTLYYLQGAQNSQTSTSHSLQFGYTDRAFQLITTIYYDTIKDLILWGNSTLSGTTEDGMPILLWETNLADITQKGIEIEFKWHPQNNIKLYGNYAYANTSYDDALVTYNDQVVMSLVDSLYTDDSLQMAGAPKSTWNLGFDWDLSSYFAWNLNYHGRYGVLSIYPNPEWERFGYEHFFDTNIRYLHFLTQNSELDFYIKNITKNRGKFPTGYGEVETQLGRQIGFKWRLTF